MLALEEATIRISERKIEVEGKPVHYKVVGKGEPVILVHGLSGSTHWWRRNVPVLAQHYQVYLVDLPGFGGWGWWMHRPSYHFALTRAASWLLLWMDALGLRQAHLVGHSMGGYLCLWIAAHKPKVVKRLVLIGPAGVPTGRSLPGYLAPLLTAIRYMSLSFLPILLYDALRAGPLTLLRAAQDLLTKDVRENLKSIVAPTLLIWGEKDTLVPPELGEILRKEIANSRLLILKGAGHVVMFDRAQNCNEALLAFLAGEPVGK